MKFLALGEPPKQHGKMDVHPYFALYVSVHCPLSSIHLHSIHFILQSCWCIFVWLLCNFTVVPFRFIMFIPFLQRRFPPSHLGYVKPVSDLIQGCLRPVGEASVNTGRKLLYYHPMIRTTQPPKLLCPNVTVLTLALRRLVPKDFQNPSLDWRIGLRNMSETTFLIQMFVRRLLESESAQTSRFRSISHHKSLPCLSTTCRTYVAAMPNLHCYIR